MGDLIPVVGKHLHMHPHAAFGDNYAFGTSTGFAAEVVCQTG